MIYHVSPRSLRQLYKAALTSARPQDCIFFTTLGVAEKSKQRRISWTLAVHGTSCRRVRSKLFQLIQVVEKAGVTDLQYFM
jgi:hypothetical protein